MITADIDVTAVDAPELHASAVPADTSDADLLTDPEVSAQVVPANTHAYFSFGRIKEPTKIRRKASTPFVHHTCHWRIVDDS